MITFDDYKNIYKGVTISDIDIFNNVVIEAETVVDGMCVNKSALSSDFAQRRYTLAVCAACDTLHSYNQAGSNVASMRVGDYSVSYSTAPVQEQNRAVVSTAMRYLRGTNLLYGGMDSKLISREVIKAERRMSFARGGAF